MPRCRGGWLEGEMPTSTAFSRVEPRWLGRRGQGAEAEIDKTRQPDAAVFCQSLRCVTSRRRRARQMRPKWREQRADASSLTVSLSNEWVKLSAGWSIDGRAGGVG